MRILASGGRLLEAVDALLEWETGLEILHEIVGANSASVDVRRPEVGLERLIVREAALGGLPGRLDEDVLHLLGIARLRREEETRSTDDTVGAQREERGDLRASRNTAGSHNRRLREGGPDGRDEVEDRRGVRAAVSASLDTLGDDNVHLPLVPRAEGLVDGVAAAEDLRLVGALRVVLTHGLDVLVQVVSERKPDRGDLLGEDGGDARVLRRLRHVEDPAKETDTDGEGGVRGDLQGLTCGGESLLELLR